MNISKKFQAHELQPTRTKCPRHLKSVYEYIISGRYFLFDIHQSPVIG